MVKRILIMFFILSSCADLQKNTSRTSNANKNLSFNDENNDCLNQKDDSGFNWAKNISRHQAGGWIWFPGRGIADNREQSSRMAEGSSLDLLVKECGAIPQGVLFNEKCVESKKGSFFTYTRAAIKDHLCDKKVKINTKLTNNYKNYIKLLNEERKLKCNKSNLKICIEKVETFLTAGKIKDSYIYANDACGISSETCSLISDIYKKNSRIHLASKIVQKGCYIGNNKDSCHAFHNIRAYYYRDMHSYSYFKDRCFDQNNADDCYTAYLLATTKNNNIKAKEVFSILDYGVKLERKKPQGKGKLQAIGKRVFSYIKGVENCSKLKDKRKCSKDDFYNLYLFNRELGNSELIDNAKFGCEEYNNADLCYEYAENLQENLGRKTPEITKLFQKSTFNGTDTCTSLFQCMDLAWKLYQGEFYLEAQRLYRKFFDSIKNNPVVMNNYALNLIEIDATYADDALKYFRFSCDNGISFGCLNIANNLASKKKYNESKIYLKRALELGYRYKNWLLKNPKHKNLWKIKGFKRLVNEYL